MSGADVAKVDRLLVEAVTSRERAVADAVEAIARMVAADAEVHRQLDVRLAWMIADVTRDL